MPSMDWSHFQADRLPAWAESTQLPIRFNWCQQGITTRVQDQGECGACYAYAFLGSLESKLQIDGAGRFDYSENHAKECNWEEVTGYAPQGRPVGSCDGGNYFMMINLYSQLGSVLETCDPFVPSDVPCHTGCPYQRTVLGWTFASGTTIPNPEVLKAYLYEYGPLATTMYTGQFSTEAWRQEFSQYDGSYTLYHPSTQTPNHGILIVGWDDELQHAGGSGAWIVKNSWGTQWGGTCGQGGERGYFKIAYGSANLGTLSGFVSDWQNFDPGGGLLLYDEAGADDATGWVGKKEDWGLVKFTAPQNTTVTRVEFWTSDATSDVDVYIYGGFDGTRLSNLLRSVLDLSANEPGYYSVPVQPLYVPTAADVVAVVKFTNWNSEYPVSMDSRGPSERQRTYHSPTGADGSWRDVGDAFGSDVAIRLRTSGAAPTATPTTSPTPTVSPTFKPFTPTAWVWLPVIVKDLHWAAPPTATPTHTTTQPTSAPTQTSIPSVTPTPTTIAAQSGVIALPGKPYSLSLNPANRRFYVARSTTQDLAVLDLTGLAQIATVPLAKGPQAVRVNAALGRAYASYSNPLYVVSCASNAVVGEIAHGVYRPSEMAINPSNHRVYVADWSVILGEPDRVRIYDGSDNQLISSVDVGTSSVVEDISVAVNKSSGKAYAAYSGDKSIAIIGANDQLDGRITPSDMATSYEPWMAINPYSNRLYLRGTSTTQVIDLNTNAEIATLDEDGLIAVDTARNLVYVHTSRAIHVFSGANGAKLREIPLSEYRYVTDIACDSDTGRVFLAAPNDDEVVVVQD